MQDELVLYQGDLKNFLACMKYLQSREQINNISFFYFVMRKFLHLQFYSIASIKVDHWIFFRQFSS